MTRATPKRRVALICHIICDSSNTEEASHLSQAKSGLRPAYRAPGASHLSAGCLWCEAPYSPRCFAPVCGVLVVRSTILAQVLRTSLLRCLAPRQPKTVPQGRSADSPEGPEGSEGRGARLAPQAPGARAQIHIWGDGFVKF